MQKVECLYTMENGVKAYDLTDFVTADLDVADAIWENADSDKGRMVHPTSQYVERVGLAGVVGTYAIPLEDRTQYERFCEVLRPSSVRLEYEDYPEFIEWFTGYKIKTDGRKVKLGKFLRSKGIEQSIIDFYSQQVKTGSKTVYVTVSDMPQHIAGMTAYASDWTSCQDVDGSHCDMVAGSLYDESLLIGFLHESLEDLEDMDGKMLARTILRPFTHPTTGNIHIMATKLYGNHVNRTTLDNALDMLNETYIHSTKAQEECSNPILMTYQGTFPYHGTHYSQVCVQRDTEHEMQVECPHCEGTRKETVEVPYGDEYQYIDVEVDCQTCDGEGEIWTTHYDCVDEWIDVEVPVTLEPYSENYKWSQFGHEMVVSGEYFDRFYARNEG